MDETWKKMRPDRCVCALQCVSQFVAVCVAVWTAADLGWR